MHSYYTFLALDIARERAAEANAVRLANLRTSGASRTPAFRRAIARAALAVARVADRNVRVSLSPR